MVQVKGGKGWVGDCRTCVAVAAPAKLFLFCLLSISVWCMPISEQLTGPSRATSRENNFLIPTEPPRGGPTPVTQSNIAAHLLTQFGLQVQSTGSLHGWVPVCRLLS